MKGLLDKIKTVILSIVILSLSVTSFILKDNIFSNSENRELARMPKLTTKKLFSGEYTLSLGDYIADQFPLRDTFVGLKAYSELAQLKKENNGVIYTEEALIARPTNNIDRLTNNLECINDFTIVNNLSVIVAPIPRAADVYSEFLPHTYPTENDRFVWKKLYSESENKAFRLVDLYESLCTSNSFYKTDHHYTTDGAYIVYQKLGSYLGYTPKNVDFFDIQQVTKMFSGTSIRTSGFYLFENDKINLYRYDADTKYKVIADNKSIELYDFEKLNSTDKYAVFLGGNHSKVDITCEGENREKILMIRDSFADSLVPFLAIHFDITLIDLRYYTDSVAKLVQKENINKVLVLENIEELCTAKNISYLRMK